MTHMIRKQVVETWTLAEALPVDTADDKRAEVVEVQFTTEWTGYRHVTGYGYQLTKTGKRTGRVKLLLLDVLARATLSAACLPEALWHPSADEARRVVEAL